MYNAELIQQLRGAKPLAQLLLTTGFRLPLSAPNNELLIGLANTLDTPTMIDPLMLKQANITSLEITALYAGLKLHLKRGEEQLLREASRATPD